MYNIHIHRYSYISLPFPRTQTRQKPFCICPYISNPTKQPAELAKASSKATSKFSTDSSSSLFQDPSQTQSYLSHSKNAAGVKHHGGLNSWSCWSSDSSAQLRIVEKVESFSILPQVGNLTMTGWPVKADKCGPEFRCKLSVLQLDTSDMGISI